MNLKDIEAAELYVKKRVANNTSSVPREIEGAFYAGIRHERLKRAKEDKFCGLILLVVCALLVFG